MGCVQRTEPAHDHTGETESVAVEEMRNEVAELSSTLVSETKAALADGTATPEQIEQLSAALDRVNARLESIGARLDTIESHGADSGHDHDGHDH